MSLLDLPPELFCDIASFLDPSDVSSLFKTCRQLREKSGQQIIWVDILRCVQKESNTVQRVTYNELSAKQAECLATRSCRFPFSLLHTNSDHGSASQYRPRELQSVRLPLRPPWEQVEDAALVPGGRYLITVHSKFKRSGLFLWDLGIHAIMKAKPEPIACRRISHNLENPILKLQAVVKESDGLTEASTILAVMHSGRKPGQPRVARISIYEVLPPLHEKAFRFLTSSLFPFPKSFVISSDLLALANPHTAQINIWNFRQNTMARIWYNVNIFGHISRPQLILMTSAHLVLGYKKSLDVLDFSQVPFLPVEGGLAASPYETLASVTLPHSEHAATTSFSAVQSSTNSFTIRTNIIAILPESLENEHVYVDLSFTTDLPIISPRTECAARLTVLSLTISDPLCLSGNTLYKLPGNYWISLDTTGYSLYEKGDPLKAFLECSRGNSESITLHHFTKRCGKVRLCFCPMTGRLCAVAERELLVMDFVDPIV